jgi:hypothetical protein
MELITYKVIFKETADEWLFQYRKSDGIIYNFINLKGSRILSLLAKNQFPENTKMMEEWTKYKKKIDIKLVLDDYKFETFWNKYDLKQKKELCEKAYDKLTLVEKIACFDKLPSYDAFLLKTKQNKALLVTWINQKRYNDEFKI